MPASRISICSGANGSFVLRESNFNRDRFVSARDDLSRPYPKAEDVYLQSDASNPEEEFADLGLSDFFIAHRRVARRKLDCLQLTALQVSFFFHSYFPLSWTYRPVCYPVVLHHNLKGKSLTTLSSRQQLVMLGLALCRPWTRELSSSLLRERESTRALTVEMGQMRHLVNGLTGELGRLRDDHT